MDIKNITNKQANEIIESRIPIGLFYARDGDRYVGIDNLTGHAWVEEFENSNHCITWLKNFCGKGGLK